LGTKGKRPKLITDQRKLLKNALLSAKGLKPKFKWGGRRKNTTNFTPCEHQKVCRFIWDEVTKNPTLRGKEIQLLIFQRFRKLVSRSWICRLFKRWRWSFHSLKVEQVQKYRPDNVAYYGTYLESILQIPWVKIKYCDESHFISKGLIFLFHY
jgi:hypothetical protein